MTTQATHSLGPAAPARREDRGPLLVLGVLVVSLAIALVIMFLRWPDGDGFAAPADDSAAAGFARDMQEHHAQAVEMSMIVRDRTDDESVRRIAYDIALGQQYQIGAMGELLRVWGLSQTGSGPSMAWMGHAGHGGMPMPGMASEASLERLRKASGVEAELEYLRLMTIHHRGGVEMAEAALARTDVPAVRDLAEKMLNAQKAEIETMNTMIVERGGKPVR